MDLSDDSHDYERYSIIWYLRDHGRRGPPLIKKKSRIIFTVVQNDVEGLAELLDSPKWYKVTDKDGLNILQIAILRQNKEVFNYMLSLKDFPVDEANKKGQTALEVALTGYVSNDMWMYNVEKSFLEEYFAYELLKKDVKIDIICDDGRSLLHYAFERGFTRTARLLIEMGADVNAQDECGETPLFYCLYGDDELVEGVTMLLAYGADPLICNDNNLTILDFVFTRSGNVMVAQEALYNYTFDQYSDLQIDFDVLLAMAQHKNPLFEKVLKNVPVVNNNDKSSVSSEHETLTNLFSIEPYYLRLLMENCESVLFSVFDLLPIISIKNLESLINIDLLINSKFQTVVINAICKMDSYSLIRRLIIDKKYSECAINEILCYLLSFGLTLSGETLEFIYKHFGLCDLFKFLLYMDIDVSDVDERRPIIPTLYYKMDVDVNGFLQKLPSFFSLESFSNVVNREFWRGGLQALAYFSSHPNLQNTCERNFIASDRRFPQVPLLVELARDVFRKYFIEECKIKTSAQFYTKLNLLPVAKIHKKIIAFEHKLYNFDLPVKR